MSSVKPKLENWSVIGYNLDPYKAPEQMAICLAGNVYGHPNKELYDGKEVVTTPIRMISYKNKVAQTRNTAYDLGEPHPDFVKFLNERGISIERYELGLEN